MNTLLERIKKAGGRLEDTIRRLPCSFTVLCLISLCGIYQILSEKETVKLFFSLIVAVFFCFLLEIAYEYEVHKLKVLTPLTAVSATLISYLLLKHYGNIYIYTALAGLSIAAISLIFYVLYAKRENRELFSHLIKSAFIVEIFAGVIMSGISVCLAAFHFLIFHFDEVWKIYGIISILVMGLFNATLFFSYVPKPDEKISVPATYRTIIHKALFYIYLILIAILYLYIFKIIITWKMPVGKLNWFGCFALLFYVFFYLSVDESDGRYQKLFKQHGVYLLLPILAIQLFAIIIRLNAYGLTTARMMSLILITAAVGFMVSQALHIPVARCFLFTALLAILFSCTPFNIYDVPDRVQEKRLKDALIKGGALNNGVLDDQVKMEARYLEDVRSAYEYLRYSDGRKSAFYEEFEKSKIAKALDHYDPQSAEIRSFYYNTDLTNKEIDIASYSKLEMISQDDEHYQQELTPFLLSLDESKTADYQQDGLEYELSDGSKIIFRYISYDYNEDEKSFVYLYFEGLRLGK